MEYILSLNKELEDIPTKFGWLAPGQGIQSVGMGAALYQKSEAARTIFDQTAEIAGPRLLEIMTNGPQEQLDQTANAQPAIVSTTLAAYYALFEKNPTLIEKEPVAVVGHSLGEISALAIAGVVDPPTAIEIAVERGRLMQREGERADVKGGMVALRATLEQSSRLLETTLITAGRSDGIYIANHNAPDQIVMSGEEELLRRIQTHAGEQGVRSRRLGVSIPAHSPLMARAQQEFAQFLDKISFQRPHTPMILNSDAEITDDPEKIKASIAQALTNGVWFAESMQKLHQMGVQACIELGQGPLSKFMQHVSTQLRLFQVPFAGI